MIKYSPIPYAWGRTPLHPCYFCGRPVRVNGALEHWRFVECFTRNKRNEIMKCGAHGPVCRTLKAAIRHWNLLKLK